MPDGQGTHYTNFENRALNIYYVGSKPVSDSFITK